MAPGCGSSTAPRSHSHSRSRVKHRHTPDQPGHDLRLEVCHERGRGLDVGRASGCGAAWEMKVWPFGAALRGGASNHHMPRWLQTVVVSDGEKGHVMRQVGTRKAIAAEVSKT